MTASARATPLPATTPPRDQPAEAGEGGTPLLANGHAPTSDPALPGSDAPHADPGVSSSPGAPDPAPPPTPRVGQWLRERRETRGLDLARVERDTKISRRYLEAIELDQLELLPAPVYARGFVRGYARYLGLDEGEALARVPRDLPRPRGLEPLPGLRRREGPPAVPAVERRWLLLVAAIGVVAVAAFVLGVPGLGGGSGDPTAGDPTARDPSAAAADGPAGAAAGAPPASTVPPFDAGRAPDFRGVERAEAEALLAELGLTVLIIEVAAPDTPPGRVFAQAPDPGTAVDPGDDVTLIISSGPTSTSSE